MVVVLSRLTPSQFAEHRDMPALLAAYAEECALSGLPTPAPDREGYLLLHSTGAFHIIGAFDDTDRMLGFCTLLVHKSPHYGVLIGFTESLFVAEKHRATGAGLLLLREAKRVAKEKCAHALFVAAPAKSALCGVLACMGATETNRVFMWGFE